MKNYILVKTASPKIGGYWFVTDEPRLHWTSELSKARTFTHAEALEERDEWEKKGVNFLIYPKDQFKP